MNVFLEALFIWNSRELKVILTRRKPIECFIFTIATMVPLDRTSRCDLRLASNIKLMQEQKSTSSQTTCLRVYQEFRCLIEHKFNEAIKILSKKIS